jgi:hypothetical protein
VDGRNDPNDEITVTVVRRQRGLTKKEGSYRDDSYAFLPAGTPCPTCGGSGRLD